MKNTPAATLQARSAAPVPSVKARKATGKAHREKVPSEEPYRSPAERRAEGKRLRDAVPRAEHSGWNPPKKRRDPVELVLVQNEGAGCWSLCPIRHGRMVLAGRHIRLKQSQSARAARAAVRSYREHMGEYAFMKALEIWYDRIDLKRLLDRVPDEAARARDVQRIKEARRRNVAEHDFPKLAEQAGSMPRIKDNPPLIFHHPDTKEGMESGNIKEAWALYRESLPEHTRVLFDRFHLCDMAAKVVGVGSVGTMCLIGLFMAADDDPLFLQIKQANASVLEPYAGKSVHGNHGQRVVVGQRLMQAASDIFLGWTQTRRGRHFYVRQLRDMKLSAIIVGFDDAGLRLYAEACGWALARAHARSGDAAMISGYMGSSRTFDEAICDFAVDYADQAERDHKAFVKAVREGRVNALVES